MIITAAFESIVSERRKWRSRGRTSAGVEAAAEAAAGAARKSGTVWARKKQVDYTVDKFRN